MSSIVTTGRLSAKRAVSVATEMLKGTGLEKDRLVVVGRADTRPFGTQRYRQNRRRNRRVEISILQGKAKESQPLQLRENAGDAACQRTASGGTKLILS